MSRVDDLPPRLRAAAEAVIQARRARDRQPPIPAPLDGLLPYEVAYLAADVTAALAAAEDHDMAVALSPAARLSEGYADALRLDLGAGALLILMRDRQARASAAFTATGAGTMTLGHDAANDLWRAVAGFVRVAAQPLTPAEQEPTP